MVGFGATLPVRYHPDRDDGRVALATDAAQAEVQRVHNLVQVAEGHLDADGLRIAEHGLDARALVLAMRPTGQVRGGRPVLELTLRVAGRTRRGSTSPPRRPSRPRSCPGCSRGR